MTHDLRAAGLVVDYSLTPTSDRQFKRAQETQGGDHHHNERNPAGELLVRSRN